LTCLDETWSFVPFRKKFEKVQRDYVAMSGKAYHDELEGALARPDAELMERQLDAYATYMATGPSGAWPEEHEDAFSEIISCYHDDPEKAFAYVILGAARTDDARFLGLLGCGLLEDVLQNPSDELLERVVAEARKSARFRWLLSNPFKVAIAPRAWEAIERFRITGPHEEPAADKLPPRNRSSTNGP
jgi:hypothetical protein